MSSIFIQTPVQVKLPFKIIYLVMKSKVLGKTDKPKPKTKLYLTMA